MTQADFVPVTVKQWPDLVKLFGARGACAGCWCMWWRLPQKEWVANKGAPNQHALHLLVASGPPPGILAYIDNQPVGWCAVAPRESYLRLERSPSLKRIDNEPVWSVSCLFVSKALRRQGLSVQLLNAAADYVRSQKGRIVEGYPFDPQGKQRPDAFIWTGTVAAFANAGFVEVARQGARPIMRRQLY
jgi:GNAT superfamily N-acetyltransferase